MRFVFFYHSISSDWNNGHAHFLRGIVRALLHRGHDVRTFEPADGWSRQNLLQQDPTAIKRFRARFPELRATLYTPQTLDIDEATNKADVIIVGEWNDPGLIARLSRHRARGATYRLFFHDAHHRSVSRPDDIGTYDLDGFDGILTFGEVVREIYLKLGWSRQAWTWHEAADIRSFHPMRDVAPAGDLVWIGNWGDGERTRELAEYLVTPSSDLGLDTVVHGVCYPEEALKRIADAGIAYKGWLPNYDVPETFSRFRTTVHVPRAPYAKALPGIPTIRVFEALACGIPLVSAPWNDTEGLFGPDNFLRARNSGEMKQHLRALMADADLRKAISANGLATILARHTCDHRVEHLLDIARKLSPNAGDDSTPPRTKEMAS